MKKSDPFFDYYQRELNYLRYSGADFARKYPKIARRLDFSGAGSGDPHVERLLESFAYLTARLQKDADDQFPRFAEAILGVLYPQFSNPVPSFAIARFEPLIQGGKATTSHIIEREHPLFARTNDGTVCRFRTVYPLELPPVTIQQVEMIQTQSLELPSTTLMPPRLIRIRLSAGTGTFAGMKLKKLRLYIAGNAIIKRNLLQDILTAKSPLFLMKPDGSVVNKISFENLYHMGFDPEDAVLPWPQHTHPGYRLLFEYFHFNEKFFFIELRSEMLSQDTSVMDLLIPLSPETILNPKDIGNPNILLGCTPIINLFPKITEPIAVDHRSYEYRLVPDQRLEHSTEIHSIQEVIGAIEGENKTETYAPFFSYDHYHHTNEQKTFWLQRRTAINRPGFSGSDIYLSFMDLDMKPCIPPRQTIYAKTLCTNRNLASHVPPGSSLFTEKAAPIHSIMCLDRPTAQNWPVQDGEILWRLVSHLNLNHLAFSGGPSSISVLREMIQLYARHNTPGPLPETEALQDVRTTRITRRFGDEAWRGFVQGTKITLVFDRVSYPDFSIFLFSSVMNHFLGMMAAVNTFTQLEVEQYHQEGAWITWDPLAGTKVLL